MLKSEIFTITSITFLLISSCSNVSTSTNNIESTAVIQIPTKLPTLTPTSVPTKIVSTLTPSPPENILKFQPFEIKAELPPDAQPMGMLAICSDSSISLLRFIPDIKMEILAENISDPLCDGASPDGKWIAYEQDSKESPTGQWLIVQSVDGQQNKILLDRQAISFDSYLWLDNQRLIFPLIQGEHRPAYPMVVVNPFNDEQIKLTSDYPELQLSPAGPPTSMDFNFSDVVYDPSLEYVIFSSWGGEHNYIVLWDRKSKTEAARVEDHGVFGHYPIWSPNAKQFAIAVVNREDKKNVVEEWYLVSKGGKVEQLTHFGDYFTSTEINVANWSPDGKKLAFWIDLNPSPCPELNLAILDIPTKEVTDTCLLGSLDYAPPPIWSLDSRYIVIRNASTSPIKTILADVENGWAFDITALVGDSPPIGWMVSP